MHKEVRMGTRDRLRKLAKREAEKMGHKIGNFVYRGCGEYAAWCMECHSVVFIEVTEDRMQRIVSMNNKYDSLVTNSGLTAKEAYPKRSKGSIFGPIVNYNCKELKENNTIGLSPLDMYCDITNNRGRISGKAKGI